MEQPPSVAGAVVSNDRRTSLVALRNKLAVAIDECDSMRDLAALSRQLADVLQQIDAIPGEAEVSAADEVAKRRAVRRAGASGPARSGRPG